MTEYKLLGLKINILPEYELKNKLLDFLNSSNQHQIITTNPEFIVVAQKNQKFFDIINQSSISLIDGSGIAMALKYLDYNVSLDNRVTGVRLTEILINLAIAQKSKMMFCLYQNGLTNKYQLSDTLRKKFPKLNFKISYQDDALEIAAKFLPDVILVGYGAPLQDIWIFDNLKKIPTAKIAAGVGGTFDFMSGTIKRAPKIMQSLALEWLWRLILKPKRLMRIIRAVIIFPYFVIRYQKNQKNYG